MGMDPITMAIGGAVLGGLLGSQKEQPSMQMPQMPAAPPEPQAAKAPDSQTVRAGQAGMGQAGGAPGVADTFLTGAGGIDPKLLALGRTTLLGG